MAEFEPVMPSSLTAPFATGVQRPRDRRDDFLAVSWMPDLYDLGAASRAWHETFKPDRVTV
jgi:hypothetical protein